MPAKDHAAWDVVAAAPLRWWHTPSGRRRSATQRTAFLAGEDTMPDPDRIRETVIARYKPAPLLSSRIWWWPTLGWSFKIIIFSGFGLTLVLLFYWHTGTLMEIGLLPLGAMLFGLSFAATSIPFVRRSRAWRRATGQRCPDCDYDLSACEAPPPLDPETLGINLGPRHCPECGALWPLVPPSYPAEPMPPLRP